MSTKLNTDPSKVTASTGSNPGYAIDPTGATVWYSTSGPAQWVKYDFTTAKTIHKMSFLPIDGNRIKDFKCQGSNDDSGWTDLLSAQHGDNLTNIEYTLTATGNYRWYKFLISSKWGTGNVACTKWSLLQDAVNATVTPSILSGALSLLTPLIVIPKTITAPLLTLTGSLLTPANIGVVQLINAPLLSLLGVLLSPAFIISSKVLPQILSGALTLLPPTTPGLKTINNATKILSFNPLIVVTNNNPLRIAKIDITDANNPSWDVYDFSSLTGANDIVYDSIFGKIFISCNNGKLLELDSTNFASYTIYNIGVSSNISSIDLLAGYQLVVMATASSLGEIVVMDDSTKIIVTTDLRWAQQVEKILNCCVNTTNGAIVNCDCRWSAETDSLMNLDIRFNTVSPGNYEEPISRDDFRIFIDGVEAFDVKKDEINIYHTENEKSRATLILARNHDNLDYTLEGVYSQITNQNAIRIELDGHIEFNGFVNQIDAASDTEHVQLIAFTDDPKSDERSLVNLSIPSINERLTIYHALIHNPTIENPRVLADDLNPSIYKGVFIDSGWDEKQNVSRWTSFLDSAVVAQDVSNGIFIPKQNWTYFWFAKATNFITGVYWATLNYIGTSPSSLANDTWDITGLSYRYQRKFDSTKIRLGTGIVYANDFKYNYNPAAVAMYNALAPHDYVTYTYTTMENVVRSKIHGFSTSDLATVLSIMESNIGSRLGTAPYRKVSSKCGRLVAVDQWEDKPDGLYVHRDESYDYRAFAQQVLSLEYQKIQNINGTVLPKTSATIELFIDGYYYYNIALLKRLNIDNTTAENIYKNQNGFPVSVKSIEINSGTMKVQLRCDNQWSKTELFEIEANYPQPDDDTFLFPESDKLLFSKFDPRTMGDIE